MVLCNLGGKGGRGRGVWDSLRVGVVVALLQRPKPRCSGALQWAQNSQNWLSDCQRLSNTEAHAQPGPSAEPSPQRESLCRLKAKTSFERAPHVFRLAAAPRRWPVPWSPWSLPQQKDLRASAGRALREASEVSLGSPQKISTGKQGAAETGGEGPFSAFLWGGGTGAFLKPRQG